VICEYCNRTLRRGDTIHGIKYGTLTTTGFKAAQDSAVTVICGDCGTLLYQIVYGNLDNEKLSYPTIFKMLGEIATLMKNQWKFAQEITQLPRAEQVTLKRLVSICKIPR